MEDKNFFGYQSINISKGVIEIFYYLAVVGDKESVFDRVMELFFKLYKTCTFIVPKEIFNRN